MALDLAATFTPLSPEEAETIKRKGLETTPLFRNTVCLIVPSNASRRRRSVHA
jgi:hypothetical protein